MSTPKAMTEIVASRDAMARILAVAGHDLRQPLQVALLALEQVASSGSTSSSSEWLCAATDALRRLDNELSDIARMSQHETLKVPSIQPVRLDAMMERVELDWRHYAELCGIRLIIDRRSITVWTDPMILRSILRNLVGNAIRYGGADSTVIVGCVVIGSVVRVSVRDEGCGISPTRIDRIFEAFARGGREDGLGLGLTIVRQMSEALSLPVTVQSMEGVGSTFAVDLPLAPVCPSGNDVVRPRAD